ncbi:hypothetical protein [Collimonas sp.]|jgi:hypothetical protein|uniref:hypothetical protein n=1 Tax=Collimonas sp. TaxID=1963772 RepID=UPI002B9E16D2|nr:hypothetical protein [Collimonas sp.]HWW04948.1 hypothetical protein [Collimonas sp.]
MAISTSFKNLIKLFLPIIFFEFYLNLSVFLFAFGPWPWPVTNPVELYAYLLSAHFLLFLGYYSGLKKAIRKPIMVNNKEINWLKISLIANILLLVPTSYSRSGSIIPDILFGLSSPGEAYQNAVERSFSGGIWVAIEYLRILISPILAFTFPFIIATWRDRTKFERIACVFIVFFNIAIYVSIGTNKAIVDTVLLFPWLIALAIISGNLILTKRRTIYLSSAGLGGLFLAFLFFGYGQINRGGGVASGRNFGPPINIDADSTNWLTASLPDMYQIYVESLIRYLCQGYYALSRALLLDFDTTFGVGHSMFLVRNVESLLGITDLASRSYPARLEQAEDWGMLTLWDSIYPWIASDVGFFGALLIVFLIGRYFAMTWIYSIRDADKISILLFSYFIIILLYFPANNQLMQNGESCIGFYFTFIIWIFKISNFNIKIPARTLIDAK